MMVIPHYIAPNKLDMEAIPVRLLGMGGEKRKKCAVR